jgi:Type IX secretion system protein PorV
MSTISIAQTNICVLNGGRGCRVLQTAVPFLRITPDARSGAMGDVGIALSPDANSIHYNFAKQAFNEDKKGVAITYTPWLRALGLQDIYLAHASGFSKFKGNQAVGASIKYFSLGKIDFTDENGSLLNQGNPRELEIAAAYARELVKNKLSVSLSGKYIYSNLAAGQTVGGQLITSATALAADFGLFYRKTITTKSDLKNEFGAGLTISNIGNKVAYSLSQDYLPQNLGLGASYKMNLDKFNSLTLALDFNKLLVPTPDTLDLDGNKIKDWKEFSPFGAIGQSFSAPGGFSETVKEITWGLGVEYWYDNQFAVRTGYFHESIEKGGRQYFTAGLGLKYNIFGINLSYLVPTTNQRNPLDNTLRFSLIFDLGAFKPELEDSEN